MKTKKAKLTKEKEEEGGSRLDTKKRLHLAFQQEKKQNKNRK